jgi:hypothetical protein
VALRHWFELYEVHVSCRRRDRFPHFFHRLHMQLDRFADIVLGIFQRAAGSNATGKIGNVSRPIGFRLFEHDSVSHGSFSSAFRRMDLRVPIGKSSFQLPATVTTIGFSGCLNAQGSLSGE